MENKDQIVDEIRQLRTQYLNEVPTKRRAWPRSIKDRVLQLSQLEMPCEQIGAATGIPAATIYGWKAAAKSPDFLPVAVVTKKSEPAIEVRRPIRRRRRRSTPTITVVAPNGLRFEGLDVNCALELARELGESR